MKRKYNHKKRIIAPLLLDGQLKPDKKSESQFREVDLGMDNQPERAIAVTATFTAEPVEESLNFWIRELEIPFKIEFAPYNQVFQQLLDPSSLIRNNKDGMNVILLRFEDWIQRDEKVSSNLDPLEKERLLDNRSRYVLPNQLEIAHLNQYETEYTYKEIFEDKCYLKHGINLKDGDCVIDIGANIGLFTLFIQQKYKNTTIYTFEPSPTVFELLQINTTLYGSDVKVFNYGLSNETKEALFTFYERSSVFSTFHADNEQDKESLKAVILNMLRQISTSDTGDLGEYIDEVMEGRLESKSFICQLKSLSEVIKENNIQHIDLLKIDAEKSELDILNGIEDGDWAKIDQIVVEVHDKEGKLIKEITFLLQKKGFELFVDEEEMLKDSGLYTVFATRPSKRKELSKQHSLLDREQENIRENVENFVLSLRTAADESSTPYLVCICPVSPDIIADERQMTLFNQMEDLLLSELDNISNVYLVKSSELVKTYPVSTYYDRYSDELGRLPYTPTFFSALGTIVARKFYAIQNAPYKVIVLDCDQTLWKGICGEDGPLGIEVDPPRKKLQEFMIRQIEEGMLICLCSKNNEEDVIEVFEHHPEMPLKRDNIVSWRINWRPKSGNLKSLANELQLGLDSFVFIDDNPAECAEVQANCPEVLTLQLPQDPENIPRFLEHVWAFDHLKITEEDERRTTLYQQNIKREHFREDSLKLGDFLAGLEMEVSFFEPMNQNFARVAQLTQRTNQFNFTTIRRSDAEVQKLCQSERLECLAVEVSDRFGDYGLVGVILFKVDSEVIKVDTFLLSCRVLGRGVEHRMLAKLGEIANDRGPDYVALSYIPTKKNQPAIDFLDGIGSKYKNQIDNGFLFELPTEYAMAISYDPSLEKQKQPDELAIKKSTSQISERQMVFFQAKSERLSHIATNLYSAEQIQKTIESQPRKQRPDLSFEYIAPGNDLERAIADIWQKVLCIEKAGIQDNFFEIGGTSLKGVQLIAQLKRKMNSDVSMVNLFENPTISAMARKLGDDKSESVISEKIMASHKRGEKRRVLQRVRRR